MKKNKLILTLTLLLTLVAIFLVLQNKKGTMREELQDFAVQDTASVTKIFLANKSNKSVILERKNKGVWMVNAKYNVRPDVIRTFLSTIKSLAVKTRVAKAGYNGVMSDLAANGVKCEIYQHDESVPSKVYYVGGSTADVLGTFMILDKSSLPFVMEIPGFQGYLTPRYSPFELDWRETVVFDYTPDKIRKVTIQYYQQPEKSFSIERSGSLYKVSSPQTNRSVHQPDTIGIINYLSYFKFLCFEGWDNEYSNSQRDSLKSAVPINTVSITDVNGITRSMTTFLKPINRRSVTQTDSLGNPLKYDLDKMYAFVNDGKDFVVIQHYVFGKVFRQLDDFDMDKRSSGRKLQLK